MSNAMLNVINERIVSFSIEGEIGYIRLVDVTIGEVVVIHVAAIDLITVVSGMERCDAARILRRIAKENESFSHKFALKGGQKTALINFREALAIVMKLPGPAAKKFRRSACTVLARYMAGDVSLIEEIEEKKTSQIPHIVTEEGDEDEEETEDRDADEGEEETEDGDGED
jgi:hypothetical protein